MKIIIFTHPAFLNSTSMPRYAMMLKEGMELSGHKTTIWTAKACLYHLPFPSLFKKWLGYFDQYVLFPVIVKLRLILCPKNTLFVFADHALGPWVPLVKKRPHIIHCHDFIAQKAALGMLNEIETKKSGKFYQKYIRWGYKKGVNFISISKKTQNDLHNFLGKVPKISEVIYNGLNQKYSPTKDREDLLLKISNQLGVNLNKGYILHVGGNQFYKNRLGVLEIYDQWSKESINTIPLLMVGKKITQKLKERVDIILNKNLIYFLEDVNDNLLKELYQGATVFLFPSLYEGFGWPIAEAMASGCPVITTNEQPMNEVAGNAGVYIEKMNLVDEDRFINWKKESAKILDKVINLDSIRRTELIGKCLEQASNFDTNKCIYQIEQVYKKINK